MSTYDEVAWFPLCIGLTALGLFLSWTAWRRRGVAAGMRGAAWSLLPLAAYLTGVIALVWRIGTAVGRWATAFVFSPKVWAGVVVTGVSAALFALSGRLRRRRKPAERADRTATVSGAPTRKEVAPAGTARGASALDDDLADVEEILRRRGIT